jgi:hypothetical protein
MEDYYVYVYCDPRYTNKGKGYSYFDGKVELSCRPFYVGQGNKRRIYSYLHPEKNWQRWYSALVLKRIKRLSDLGLEPKIIHTSSLSKKQALFREEKYIVEIGRKDLKTGPLLNRCDGGPGTKNPGPFQRKKMSEVMKKQWASLKYRKKRSKSSSKNLKKMWKDPKYKKEKSRIARNLWKDPEVKAKRIEKLSKFTNEEGGDLLKEYENNTLSYQKLADKYRVSVSCLYATIHRAAQRREEAING